MHHASKLNILSFTSFFREGSVGVQQFKTTIYVQVLNVMRHQRGHTNVNAWSLFELFHFIFNAHLWTETFPYFFLFFNAFPLSVFSLTYTRAVLYRRIWTESTFMSHVSLGAHISFTLNMDLHSRRPSCVNFECLKTNVTAIKSFHFPHFSSDFRFRWRTSSCQHSDKHPQLPSQPPADAKPYHASHWSHGHSTE